jgi:hypothetical protein
MKAQLKNGNTYKVKSYNNDSLEPGTKEYHLVDSDGNTVWFNGWLRKHPQSSIKTLINE